MRRSWKGKRKGRESQIARDASKVDESESLLSLWFCSYPQEFHELVLWKFERDVEKVERRG